MGELAVSTGSTYQNQSVSTVFAGPGDGDFGAFQPGAGIAMSYDDLKVIEAARFLRSISDGRAYGATIEDAVSSALALQAVVESVNTGGWVKVSR
jgi:predicted dehydrogenase